MALGIGSYGVLRRGLPVSHYSPPRAAAPKAPVISSLKVVEPSEKAPETARTPPTKSAAEQFAEEHPIKNFFQELILKIFPPLWIL